MQNKEYQPKSLADNIKNTLQFGPGKHPEADIDLSGITIDLSWIKLDERAAEMTGKALAKGIETVLLPVTAPGELLTRHSALDDRELTKQELAERAIVTLSHVPVTKAAAETVSKIKGTAEIGLKVGKLGTHMVKNIFYRNLEKPESAN